jgi:hypothetical protein
MRAIALAFAVIGCGCAASRPATVVEIEPFGPIPEGVAQICIVRPKSGASLITTTFHDNGIRVGATRGPSFFCWFGAPGEHRITPEGTDDAIATFDVRVGRRYFLRHDAVVGGDQTLWADPAGAERFLGECDYMVLEEVASAR